MTQGDCTGEARQGTAKQPKPPENREEDVVSAYNIGDMVGDWQLARRDRQVEMWHNTVSDHYGVYLFEQAQMGDEWLLFAIRRSKDAADTLFDRVTTTIG